MPLARGIGTKGDRLTQAYYGPSAIGFRFSYYQMHLNISIFNSKSLKIGNPMPILIHLFVKKINRLADPLQALLQRL